MSQLRGRGTTTGPRPHHAHERDRSTGTLNRLAAGVVAVVILGQVAASAQSTDATCDGPHVSTTAGTVCGALVSTDATGPGTVAAFLGIPYGESTAGPNRFLAPVARAPWDGVLAALEPGPACPQTLTSLTEAPEGQSEDCLSLNVWAPAEPGEAPAPVLVFVHGGGFLVGTATDALASEDVDWFNIDGRFLAAEQGLVVVTMNYRLAAFGFLAGVAGLEGNQGLLDQQLALRWVRDNIAAFGGDPDNVTLMGESAGGTSVATHVYGMPSSSGLFQRAIIESNPAGVGVQTWSEARAQGERYLLRVGCFFSLDRLGCLQEKPLTDLQAAQTPVVDLLTLLDRGTFALLAWLPAVDGSIVTEQPLIAAIEGRTEVPVIWGNNDDEAFSFLGQFVTPDINPYVGGAVLDVLFRKNVGDVIRREYVDGASDQPTALLDGAGDYVFMCPAELAAANAPVGYHFRFSHPPQYVGGLTGGDTCGDRTCHAVELPYVFGTGRFPGGFAEADARVSADAMALWSAFARGEGDGGRGLAAWPQADPSDGRLPTMVITDPPTVAPFDLTRCEHWVEVYESR